MANEKDVFEVRYREKYGVRPMFQCRDGHDVKDSDGNWFSCGCHQGEDLAKDLNEAFRLGYRAALMEKV